METRIRKYQLLADGIDLAECVGFYNGRNGFKGLPIFKVNEIYYLAQNPTSSSIFGAFARRGYTLYWELSAYPDSTNGLKYTGNVICLFKLLRTVDLRGFILKLMKQESSLIYSHNKKQELITV